MREKHIYALFFFGGGGGGAGGGGINGDCFTKVLKVAKPTCRLGNFRN